MISDFCFKSCRISRWSSAAFASASALCPESANFSKSHCELKHSTNVRRVWKVARAPVSFRMFSRIEAKSWSMSSTTYFSRATIVGPCWREPCFCRTFSTAFNVRCNGIFQLGASDLPAGWWQVVFFCHPPISKRHRWSWWLDEHPDFAA
jgi:hypothetical protein